MQGISKDLEYEFFIENKRMLFAKPKANMKKLVTVFQYHLYNTRMLIELNFRNHKKFHNLVTSLPRSVDGYLSNYTHPRAEKWFELTEKTFNFARDERQKNPYRT